MASTSAPSFRRTLGAITLTGALAVGLGLSGASAQVAQTPEAGESVEIIDHGELAVEADLNIANTGTLPDGTNAHYVVGAGNPANFHVVNADTGAVISTHSIEPRSMGGAVQVADDGSAYFQLRDGSGASLYHWDSETHEVELIAENPVGQRFVQNLHLEDGVLYGSTYPSAKVFSYDLETEEFHDYGSVVSDDIYAAAMTITDGTAYVGTGMEVGRAVAVDLDTGEMTELQIPADYDERLTRFYASQQVGDLIAMAFSTGPGHEGTNTLFYDTATEEWVCDSAIPEMVSLNSPYTDQTQDGRMFYLSEGEIWQFDSSDCSVEPTGWIDTDLAETGNHRTLNVLATGEDAEDFTLIGMNRDGSYWTFDPETGDQEIFTGQIQPSPLTAHSVHVGLDDRVYMGTYNGPGTLGRFDPDTGELEAIAGPSQADSFLNFGDQMLVGSYANAVVHSGDPTDEWDWGTNPEQQFRL
ncbi:MAG TPA: hypothetical protein VK095_13230, partial [Beutenbergiaceae bacterium]|nr:hypothetical protein [Beutenbergiaceae bacterium]